MEHLSPPKKKGASVSRRRRREEEEEGAPKLGEKAVSEAKLEEGERTTTRTNPNQDAAGPCHATPREMQ